MAWGDGDEAAFQQWIPVVHGELRRIAQHCMAGERPGHSLQTSALVNEAYLRLVDASRVNWRNRAHFLAMAARLMRRVLVDYARSRGYQKRGGDAVRVTFAESLPVAGDDSLLAQVDEALQALARLDERKSRVVELKFFGGLTVPEIAQVLGVVMRDWKFAKAWLTRQMAGAQPARPGKPDFRRED